MVAQYNYDALVNRKDNGGAWWDIALDLVSIGFSIADVAMHPTDPWAWVGLGADIACTAVPFISGGGTVVRAATKVDDVIDATKAVSKVDDVVDVAKPAGLLVSVPDLSKGINNSGRLFGNVDVPINYTQKVIDQMGNINDLNHSFPILIDNSINFGISKPLVGGDKIIRNYIEIPGSINHKEGVFEYIIEPNGSCNHRYFRNFK